MRSKEFWEEVAGAWTRKAPEKTYLEELDDTAVPEDEEFDFDDLEDMNDFLKGIVDGL